MELSSHSLDRNQLSVNILSFTATNSPGYIKALHSRIGRQPWFYEVLSRSIRKKRYFPNKLFRLLKGIRLSPKPYFIGNAPCGLSFVGDYRDIDTAMWMSIPENNLSLVNLVVQKANLKDGIILDIGSNVGLVAALVARQLPDREVIAFEPDPDTFLRAAATFALNGLTNITLVHAAVSDSTGHISFYRKVGHTGGSSASPVVVDTPGLGKSRFIESKVPCITLNDFASKYITQKVGFMIIDVEGHEPKVIQGAIDVIEKDAPSILYEYNELAQGAGWSHKDIQSIIDKTGRKYQYGVLLDGSSHLSALDKDHYDQADIFCECVDYDVR